MEHGEAGAIKESREHADYFVLARSIDGLQPRARRGGTRQSISKEPLNKFIQDLSEDANKNVIFLLAHICNDLLSLKNGGT